MKVFVTGATGFIGRRLVEKLIANKEEVVALVRGSQHKLPQEVHVVCGDILSPDSWKNALCGCGKIYHLAAMISFGQRKLKQLLEVNEIGTRNVLEAASKCGVESATVVSSAATMGLSGNKDRLLDESSLLSDKIIEDNPYLSSKLACESAALEYFQKFKVTIVNPTTVYGAGDWTLNSGTLVKKIAKSKIVPLPPGGSNVIDVEDVVKGIILAGHRGATGKRYILGGYNLTFKEIFEQIAEVVENRPVFVPIPRLCRFPLSTLVDIMGRFSSNRFFTRQIVDSMFYYKFYSVKSAEEDLGFKATVSFSESIKRAWNFYLANGLINKKQYV